MAYNSLNKKNFDQKTNKQIVASSSSVSNDSKSSLSSSLKKRFIKFPTFGKKQDHMCLGKNKNHCNSSSSSVESGHLLDKEIEQYNNGTERGGIFASSSQIHTSNNKSLTNKNTNIQISASAPTLLNNKNSSPTSSSTLLIFERSVDPSISNFNRDSQNEQFNNDSFNFDSNMNTSNSNDNVNNEYNQNLGTPPSRRQSFGLISGSNSIPSHYHSENYIAAVLDATAEIVTDEKANLDDIGVISPGSGSRRVSLVSSQLSMCMDNGGNQADRPKNRRSTSGNYFTSSNATERPVLDRSYSSKDQGMVRAKNLSASKEEEDEEKDKGPLHSQLRHNHQHHHHHHHHNHLHHGAHQYDGTDNNLESPDPDTDLSSALDKALRFYSYYDMLNAEQRNIDNISNYHTDSKAGDQNLTSLSGSTSPSILGEDFDMNVMSLSSLANYFNHRHHQKNNDNVNQTRDIKDPTKAKEPQETPIKPIASNDSDSNSIDSYDSVDPYFGQEIEGDGNFHAPLTMCSLSDIIRSRTGEIRAFSTR
ncbi:hypothetical protein PACTADRAFT_2930 [Pachysolen tannophilus NRRL Y-2460]|uniref:Uncharacterized protein n=1 Tax=Pachysolen tannophilus NRRL Y-2460 TaxID=669874 RepID=A0A1E4TTZ7_PACTA|nr:hypothetical protein PACTADRAFT_2930 [Pachysolen tannophilus NRRL Y-2460]